MDCPRTPLLGSSSISNGHGSSWKDSLFFSWLNPLLATGAKKPLQRCDVPALRDQDDTAERTHAGLIQALSKVGDDHTPSSLFWAIARCHWREIWRTGALALVKTIAISCNPLFLRYFTRFVAASNGGGGLPGRTRGYLLVAALFSAKILECLSQRHWFFGARRLGLRLRSSLVAAIYAKELKLSHQSRQRHASGEIVSYISVDAYRLGEFFWWSHQLWTVPLQISIALAILVSTVGLATLSGLLVILITAAIQAPLAKIQQRNQYNLMVAQDQRLRVSSSILSSMKIIKLQAWERYFQQLIESFRAREYAWLYGVKQIWAAGSVMFWMSPVVTASVVFATCIPLSIKLDATLVFTVLATFRVIQEPVRNLPDVLTAMIQARVSLERLSKFFQDAELQEDAVERDFFSRQHDVISIDSATFAWEETGKFSLADLSLKITSGELIAVCGAVGSGKSTLLHSILGEVPRFSGKAKVCGSIGYVSQTAWIRSGSVRENILFGEAMDKTFYERVIKACALEEDLAGFSHGDLTEIGERGLNLSGGQKQRLQLARALYANAEIYLLDDPFSAVDAQTAATLFQASLACILQELRNKTVILVTHQVEFLSSVDKILVMESGRIVQSGSYQELLISSGNIFSRLVNAHEDSFIFQVHHTNSESHRHETYQRQLSKSSENKTSYQQLIQDEEIAAGNLGLKPYLDYIDGSGSRSLLGLVLVFQALFVFGVLSSNYWLATQVANPNTSVQTLIGVFTAISFASTGLVYARARFLVSIGLRASRAFFSGLINSLFRAPMAMFDSTPLGRILSRASSDMSILDVEVQSYFNFSLSGLSEMVGMVVIITLVTWQILFVAIPTLAILWRIQRYYLKTARELVRINGTTKAPVLNHTGETVNGAVPIRAFRKQSMFTRENMKLVNSDASVSLHTYAGYEWLSLRVEFLGTIVLLTAALLVVIFRDQLSSGFAGLSLTYAFALNGCQVFLIQAVSYLSGYIVAVERISQYMKLPEEAPLVIKSNRPPAEWPAHGEVELQNLQIRYRTNSPLVLKGISCMFPGGKKVGLVGRTGSGKTTLISALFRLIEPDGGRILIDRIDVTTIGLFDLRTRIGVIPQEAFLFRGTVRSNLDPLQQFSDEQIWQSLRKCQLLKAVKETPKQLDSLVSDDGENWSAGQRQLFCLARVLLKRSKVLVLDEATSSIDSTTDAVLQKVIRDEFSDCTVITVAHRISTVIDSDLILGLKNGYMVECDSPQALLDNQNSLFAKLVAEYWSSCDK
ncbi:hypothetical protein SELMODRAFT_175762 [Selaginella moellendorffii]|uniref:Uncharacterized protein n=1 Tax=Selaginella moellendorffii TaxID=88036 RepID=D8RZY5_SELML|nr:hypothetical protein SELMODRAFT_175762 [Selaginella moellendorffii]